MDADRTIINAVSAVLACALFAGLGFVAGNTRGTQHGRHEGEAMGYTVATGDMLGAFNGDAAATARLDHELPGIGHAFEKYLAWVDRPVNTGPRHTQPKAKHHG